VKPLWGAILMCLSAVGAGVHAQEPAMGVVPAPDPESKARGAVVRHLSKPATTYAANCAGCHGPSGRSVEEMPTLVGRVGYFTRIPEGRAYLVQVPGVAMSAVRDEDLAEMLNWLLHTYSSAQLSADFKPYTAAEVGELRKVTVVNPEVRRKELIQALLAAGQIPSAASLE
jgi:mono/diheme cytochrome c family protein